MLRQERQRENIQRLLIDARLYRMRLVESGWDISEQRLELYLGRDLYLAAKLRDPMCACDAEEKALDEALRQIEVERAARSARLREVFRQFIRNDELVIPHEIFWQFFAPPQDDDPLDEFPAHEELWCAVKEASPFRGGANSSKELECSVRWRWEAVQSALDRLGQAVKEAILECDRDGSESQAGQMLYLYTEAKKLQPVIDAHLKNL